MLLRFLNTLLRASKGILPASALLGLAGLAVPTARAVTSIEPAGVVSGDTYSLRIIGYNTAYPSQNVFLTFPFDATFGTTASYANYALNGQTLTVSSTEYVSGNTVNDFFSFSVPSNFVPTGTTDNGGHALNAIQFGIGIYTTGTNPLDLSPAISSYGNTGSVTFVNQGATTSGAVPMNPTLSNGGTAFSTYGQVNATSADISASQITAFSITLTYAVPEPSTNAAIALGAVGLFLVVKRRRSRA